MLAFRPLLRIAALLACSSMPLLAQGVRVKLPAWPDPVLLDSMRTEHEIAGAPEAVYGALQKAFADLDIPKGNTDGKAGIIASERFAEHATPPGHPEWGIFCICIISLNIF